MTKGSEQRAAAISTYSNMLSRVEKTLVDAESKTWEVLKDDIEKAVEFEQGLAELTREEISLIKTYLKRDLKALTHYVAETGDGLREWLRFDIDLIETRLRSTLLAIADKTTVEQEQLDLRLKHQPGTYVAGEIACPGMLRCVQCSKMVCLVETAHVEPCHDCEGIGFQRVTSRWPLQAEIEEQTGEADD